MADPTRILLIEDDVRLSALVREYLENQGMKVDVEHRGDAACARILSEQPDLVVLDLMLPGRDGLEVCRETRHAYRGPILMLTARDEDIDQVVGLELGADDYVTKPVQPRVLLARIRALLRRCERDVPSFSAAAELTETSDLIFGKLELGRTSRAVRLKGEEIEVTTSEFELLWFLADNAGEVLNRDAILEAMRGIEYDGLDRSVDVRISRLRKKLGDDSARPSRIKTVWGKGYVFVPEAWN